MSLWLYVVGGLLVVITVIVLMKTDPRPMRSLKQKTELITNVTYICLHCGNTFKGAKCPHCGSNTKQAEFSDK
jgi:rubrerythrin